MLLLLLLVVGSIAGAVAAAAAAVATVATDATDAGGGASGSCCGYDRRYYSASGVAVGADVDIGVFEVVAAVVAVAVGLALVHPPPSSSELLRASPASTRPRCRH